MPNLTITPGMIIAGRYQLIKKIGDTNIGEIYRGVDQEKNSPVNIEILGAVGNKDENIERFLQEIELTKSLKHPNLILPIDSSSVEGGAEGVSPLFLNLNFMSDYKLKLFQQEIF